VEYTLIFQVPSKLSPFVPLKVFGRFSFKSFIEVNLTSINDKIVSDEEFCGGSSFSGFVQGSVLLQFEEFHKYWSMEERLNFN